MAPKSDSSSSQTLRQGTLSFTSSKRGAVVNAGGKGAGLKPATKLGSHLSQEALKKKIKNRTPSTTSTISVDSSSETNTEVLDDDVVMLSTSSVASVQRGVKRLRASSPSAKKSETQKTREDAEDTSSDEEEEAY